MIAPRPTRLTLGLPALAVALAFLLYTTWPAATPNGDGLGYSWTTRSPHWAGKFLPGHLLYCPLMATLWSAAQLVWPGVSPATVMLLVNQIAGALGVGVLLATARRLELGLAAQIIAATGLAVSFGYWQQAIDVETYALASLGLLFAGYALARYVLTPHWGWAALAGVATAAAALFHLATLAFALAGVVTVALRHRSAWREAIAPLSIATATALLTFGVPLALVMLMVVQPTSLGDVAAWLRSADHGFRAEFGWLSLPRGVYGFVRSFVMLESFWSGPRGLIAAKAALVVLGLTLVACCLRSTLRQLSETGWAFAGGLGAFALAQTILGIYFFGSDSERWVFLLPWVWLLIAAVMTADADVLRIRWLYRPHAAMAAVLALAMLNLSTAVWPLASDHATELRARALGVAVGDEVVVITPGHDWTSYITFYRLETLRTTRVVSLVNLSLKHPDDPEAVLATLEQEIARADEHHVPVIVVRCLDPNDNVREDPWPSIIDLGGSPSRVREWLARFDWHEVLLPDPGQTVVWKKTRSTERGVGNKPSEDKRNAGRPAQLVRVNQKKRDHAR